MLPYPESPWVPSDALFKRVQLKPFDATGAFKRCALPSSDAAMELIRRHFFANKPPGLGIRFVDYIHNEKAVQEFEGRLGTMDVEAKKVAFSPEWSKEKDAGERRKRIERWKSSADLFTPLKVPSAKQNIESARVVPLWHGTSGDNCLSICSSGFATFGKHHFFDPKASKGTTANTDGGYFGSGIYFTNSAEYAALYNPENLILSFVAMR